MKSKARKGTHANGDYLVLALWSSFRIITVVLALHEAEAERSYNFLRFEAENDLKIFLNLKVLYTISVEFNRDVTRKPIKVHCLLRYGIKLLSHTCATCFQWCHVLTRTSYLSFRSCFGIVLNRDFWLWQTETCVTIVIVQENMPLSIVVNLHL